MDRLESNLKLLAILEDLIKKNPDLRFSQILRNGLFVKETRPIKPERAMKFDINWKNEFYLESKELLERVKNVYDSENT